MDYFMTEGVEPVAAVYTSPDQTGPVIYFDVDDIDASVRQARELCGTANEKMPVPGQGWFAAHRHRGTTFSLRRADPAAPMPAR